MKLLELLIGGVDGRTEGRTCGGLTDNVTVFMQHQEHSNPKKKILIRRVTSAFFF